MRTGFAIVAILTGALARPAPAQDPALVHGLWVWKTAAVLEPAGSAETVRDFCRAHAINEVYISYSTTADEGRIAGLIAVLHRSRIAAEALLSRPDGAEPGKHRDKLMEEVRAVLEFNRRRPASRFDGIHLDLEPQQLPENKGTGNLRFLPGLVESYRAVRAQAEPAGLQVNADIANKFLKGEAGDRRLLLTALPRFTLMLYELTNPTDGSTEAQKLDQLRQTAQRYLEMAYQGLSGRNLGRMSIALRTPDYGPRMPEMLRSLDAALSGDARYLGWAWHSYNDAADATRPPR